MYKPRETGMTGTLTGGLTVTVLILWTVVAAQDPSAVLTATGIRAGLAVHAGTTDGKLESELARAGTMVVQGLTTDPAAVGPARTAIAERGLFPLANVSAVDTYSELPYADNLVNLFVADCDALGSTAPGDTEIRRILAYGGKAYVRRQGSWRVVDNPTPSDVDEWPYLWHGADRLPVSRDRRAGPANALKWVAGPKMAGPSVSLRVEDGIWYSIRSLRGDGSKVNTNLPVYGTFLMARDAFSGVLLWRKELAYKGSGRGATKTGSVSLVAHNGKLFTYTAEEGSHLTAFDGHTGAVVKEYDKTASVEYYTDDRGNRTLKDGYAIDQSTVLFLGGKMVQTYRNNIWLVDEATGDVIWHQKESAPENWYYQAVVGDDGDIYAGVTVDECRTSFKDGGGGSGHFAMLKGFVRISADDGSIRWRTDAPDPRESCQFIGTPADGVLPVMMSCYYQRAEGDPMCAWDGTLIRAFSMRDGNQMWMECARFNWTSVVCAMVDGKLMATDAYQMRWYEPGTGEILYEVDHKAGGSWDPGCMSVTLTPWYIIKAPGATPWPGAAQIRDAVQGVNGGKITVSPETPLNWRPNCGETGIPAYGQVYCPGTGCGCNWYVPGDLAMHRASIQFVGDDKRLNKDGGAVTTRGVTFTGSGPVVDDWMMAVDYLNGAKNSRWNTTSYSSGTVPSWNRSLRTDPVIAGDLAIVSVIHENRIEARRNGQQVWTFLAGGRVSRPPVVTGDKVVFGCHDGYVYCISVNTGALVWRYFAAPGHRRIVSYGQVESAWPMYGLLAKDNTVVYLSGRTSGSDEGMVAGALDASTGASLWRKRVVNYTPSKYDHWINSPLFWDGEKVGYLGESFEPNSSDVIVGERRDLPIATEAFLEVPPTGARGASALRSRTLWLLTLAGSRVHVMLPASARSRAVVVTVNDVSGRRLRRWRGPIRDLSRQPLMDACASGYYVVSAAVDGLGSKTRTVLILDGK